MYGPVARNDRMCEKEFHYKGMTIPPVNIIVDSCLVFINICLYQYCSVLKWSLYNKFMIRCLFTLIPFQPLHIDHVIDCVYFSALMKIIFLQKTDIY